MEAGPFYEFEKKPFKKSSLTANRQEGEKYPTLRPIPKRA